MLPGLRSRWMMPCACAAATASADGNRNTQQLARPQALCWNQRVEVVPRTSSITMKSTSPGRVELVNGDDVRVTERGEGLCFA